MLTIQDTEILNGLLPFAKRLQAELPWTYWVTVFESGFDLNSEEIDYIFNASVSPTPMDEKPENQLDA